MLFNSYEFIFCYLPIVFCGYFVLAKYRYTKVATVFLMVASLSFYAYWDIHYLPLLLLSIIFNYRIGCYIERYRKKILLAIGIGVNFLLLGYFKYTVFLLVSLNDILQTEFIVPNIVLPLGISFFTFTQTAYLIDAYRGETKGYSFWTYGLFVTIFPHLIAGPIIYHRDMIPQFSRLRNFVINYRNIAIGLTFFSIGLFKKTIIADGIAPWANYAFSHVAGLSFFEAWVGTIAYMLQLYFDFSGYSEMAIGLGLLFNFKFPINFYSPYKALSFIDFWRRWHITFSTYLRNYLYIPLGGNRRGKIRQFSNIFLTFLLGGLWHGAGWNYILWGCMHGVFIMINHLWKAFGRPLSPFISWNLTFWTLSLTMVMFRAANVSDGIHMIKTMLQVTTIFPSGTYGIALGRLQFGNEFTVFILLGLMIFILWSKSVPELMKQFQPNLKWMLVTAILFLISLLTMSGGVSEFLYFQF